MQPETLLLLVRHRPRLVAFLASWLCKCWPAHKAQLLFRVYRGRLFPFSLFLSAIGLPCVLFVFDYATPHKEAVNVLTRYSPAGRPKQTCYLLTAARATQLALALSATLSAFQCACAPTVDVEVSPPHTGGWDLTASALLWGFLCTGGRLF